MGLVVPAVLPYSRKELEEKLALFSRTPEVIRIQIDVVDGHLAGPASWPYTALKERRAMPSLPNSDKIEYEVDLMCMDAEEAAGEWLARGASRLTFHIESVVQKGFLENARRRYGGGDIGLKHLVNFGLALNIETAISSALPYLSQVDYVQFMGIAKMGKQKQPFDARVLDKIREFRSKHPHMSVQVDGGITLDIAKRLLALSVTNLVIGSAILDTKDPIAAIAAFSALQNPYGV